MDIVQVSTEIQKRISALEKARKLLQERADKKAEAIAEYEKWLATTIVALQNGEEFDFNGVKISNPPATTTEKIARGICWNYKLEMEKAEGLYKVAVVGIQSLQAELNGWQSIFRTLEEV